ncbi:MAG: HD-GYP domain-containing protein [Thermoleophilaceae bacterium]
MRVRVRIGSLRGEAIPLGARIIAICDAYDAMTSTRPYRAAMSSEVALDELRRCSGTQFDPASSRPSPQRCAPAPVVGLRKPRVSAAANGGNKEWLARSFIT